MINSLRSFVVRGDLNTLDNTNECKNYATALNNYDNTRNVWPVQLQTEALTSHESWANSNTFPGHNVLILYI